MWLAILKWAIKFCIGKIVDRIFASLMPIPV